jgi:catechol 2,3-dioxygenase-like lactoylglutathione lyase family enzyme
MKLKLTAPLEVGICVDDLDTMVAFYTDVLGCEYVTSNDVPAELSAKAAFSGSGYTIVRLQLGTGERLKLVQQISNSIAPPDVTYVLDRRGPAFLPLIVDDLDALLTRMNEANVPMPTGPEKVEIRDGVYLGFVEDPEGNFLELVEYRDIKAYRPDLA